MGHVPLTLGPRCCCRCCRCILFYVIYDFISYLCILFHILLYFITLLHLLYHILLYFVTLFCCYIIFICVCCILFVSFASFSRSFFVRATYLRIQGRMQILRFWTEIFKNEVLQRWGGLHSTQNKKCYIEMGLNFWGVLKKCRKRPANSAFRILVPMSMLTFWKEL